MELPEEIKKLNLPEVTLETGVKIINEGEVLDKMYVLVTGKVRILIGNEKLVDVEEGGAFLGETSFLLGTKASATVEVLEDARFLVIENVTKMMSEHGELWFRVSQVLAKRMLNMNSIFMEVRHELEKHTGVKHSKLFDKFYKLMIATNDFFDRDVMHPLTETEEARRHHAEDLVALADESNRTEKES